MNSSMLIVPSRLTSKISKSSVLLGGERYILKSFIAFSNSLLSMLLELSSSTIYEWNEKETHDY